MLNIATEGIFCVVSALQETLEAVDDPKWKEQAASIRSIADGFLRNVFVAYKQIFEANQYLFT
jgi:hypothetical protein